MASGEKNTRNHNVKSEYSNRSASHSTAGTGRSGSNYRRKNEKNGNSRIVVFAIFILLMLLFFLCNIHLLGAFGEAISGFFFGVFGKICYAVPVLAIAAAIYKAVLKSKRRNTEAVKNIWLCVGIFFLVSIFFEVAAKNALEMKTYNFGTIFNEGKTFRLGGGIVSGSIAFWVASGIGKVGLIILTIVCIIILLVILNGTWLYELIQDYRDNSDIRAREAELEKRDREVRNLERREAKEQLSKERHAKALEDQRARELDIEERRKRVHLGTGLPQKDKAEGPLLTDKKLTGEDNNSIELPEHQNTPTLRTIFERNRQKNLEKRERSAALEEEKRILLEQEETNRILQREPVMPQDDYPIQMQNPDSEEMHEITGDFSEYDADEEASYDSASSDMISGSVNEDYYDYQMPHENAGDIEAATSYHSETIKEIAVPDNSTFDNGLSAGRKKAVAPKTEQNIVPRMFDESNQQNRGKVISGPQGAHDLSDDISERAKKATEISHNEQLAAAREKAAKYVFPSIELLKKGSASGASNYQELQQTAQNLADTLASFGVNVTIQDFVKGPAVTRYEMTLEPGTKVSKILSLADDIKLSLASADVRIEAPIPGKSAVGIEVPNKDISMVSLRELIESSAFKQAKSTLSFAVGKNIGGEVIVTDIAKMPHVLIAGATGSGKSVCINTLIMSIIYKSAPEDVQLIMIDPKVVELSVYNGIPHLLLPVVTDPKKASGALRWAVEEMDRRYKLFAEANVRDLAGYNEKVISEASGRVSAEKPDNSAAPATKLPKIVIIIDELADLMMVAGKEVEESICRLAQLARACGIHLVVATQRPSVDVITGLIKANMPSRMAFAVSSGTDSRTILDTVGAEKLLGKGDMLFYPQGKSKPERVQGAFVSDEEVSNVVSFLKSQRLHNSFADEAGINADTLDAKAPDASDNSTENGGSFDDELLPEAGRCIITSGKASIGYLQRCLKIGFNRAARIMDELADNGVVSADNGTKAREILMSIEEFESFVDSKDNE